MAEARQTDSTAPAAGEPAASEPVEPSDSRAAETAAPEREEHRRFKACSPSLTVVNPGQPTTPLTAGEKFRIFYRYSYDPCRILGSAFSAGIAQARDELDEYGQGAQGYGKRLGANLADTNLATFFGRFLLPTLLHDDPRYFRIGHSGTFKRRLLHAMFSPEWTRRDNGSSRFNYSRVLGDLMATSVGNAYYPEGDRGVEPTFSRAGTMLGTASASAVFQEFWPDIKARLFKKRKHDDGR